MNLMSNFGTSRKVFLVLTVFALLLFPLLGGANAGVYYVPDNSSLIQQAIDQAEPGSTIIVGPGVCKYMIFAADPRRQTQTIIRPTWPDNHSQPFGQKRAEVYVSRQQ